MGRIRVAMLWIGILAIDFAVLRLLVLSGDETVLHVAVSVPALELGLWFLLRGSSRFRGFWIGSGAIAAGWVLLHLAVAAVPADSRLHDFRVLDFYRWSINVVAVPFQSFLASYADNLAVLATSMALIYFVPQFATALAGGVLTQGLTRLAVIRIAKRRGSPINPRLEPSSSNACGVNP